MNEDVLRAAIAAMEENGNEAMDQLTAHLDRGWDLVSRGDFPGAMLSAQKSLEVDEDSPEAHNLIGYIYQAQGRGEEALEHYKTALELDEGYVDAMLNAAEVLLHPVKDHAEALRTIDEALDWLEPEELELYADALLIKTDILLAMDDREAALRTVRLLPEGPYENLEIAFQIGRARYEVGDLAGAEPYLRQATEHRPPIADAFYYLALIDESKGDRRSALVGFLSTRDLDLSMMPAPWSLPRDQFERRVQSVLMKLDNGLGPLLEGALIVVTDVPGAEVVAEGVDPRIAVLLDDLHADGEQPRVGRVFVYQRNVERAASGLLEIEEELMHALDAELRASFPDVAHS